MNQSQKKAIQALAEYGRTYGREALSKPQGIHANTLYALERLGLVETRQRPTTVVARLTREGWEAVATCT